MEQSAQQIAKELSEVRQEMAQLRNVDKELSDKLRKMMKDGEDQDYFQFITSTTLSIEDPEKALKWAKKYAPHTITVNTTAARKLFAADIKGEFGLAEKHGFGFKETEQLREVKADDDAVTE